MGDRVILSVLPGNMQSTEKYILEQTNSYYTSVEHTALAMVYYKCQKNIEIDHRNRIENLTTNQMI